MQSCGESNCGSTAPGNVSDLMVDEEWIITFKNGPKSHLLCSICAQNQ